MKYPMFLALIVVSSHGLAMPEQTPSESRRFTVFFRGEALVANSDGLRIKTAAGTQRLQSGTVAGSPQDKAALRAMFQPYVGQVVAALCEDATATRCKIFAPDGTEIGRTAVASGHARAAQ